MLKLYRTGLGLYIESSNLKNYSKTLPRRDLTDLDLNRLMRNGLPSSGPFQNEASIVNLDVSLNGAGTHWVGFSPLELNIFEEKVSCYNIHCKYKYK